VPCHAPSGQELPLYRCCLTRHPLHSFLRCPLLPVSSFRLTASQGTCACACPTSGRAAPLPPAPPRRHCSLAVAGRERDEEATARSARCPPPASRLLQVRSLPSPLSRFLLPFSGRSMAWAGGDLSLRLAKAAPFSIGLMRLETD
jgi:hypothetical protein